MVWYGHVKMDDGSVGKEECQSGAALNNTYQNRHVKATRLYLSTSSLKPD